jgi:hypothetical protein
MNEYKFPQIKTAKELSMFVSRETLVKKIKESDGQIITVDFIKRTDGRIRRLNGRLGVKAHVKGTGKSASPSCNLITIYDLQAAKDDPKKAYRSIPMEGVFAARIGGESYEVR